MCSSALLACATLAADLLFLIYLPMLMWQIVVETGRMGRQANGAVTVTDGDTVSTGDPLVDTYSNGTDQKEYLGVCLRV